jgi:hypothetical protein
MTLGLSCVLVSALVACATTSDVMDTGDGTYMISAYAAPARGGAAGATQVAYTDAKAYCSKQGGHPVVLNAASRDVYQSSFGGGSGSFGGGTFAAGNADFHFRCAVP